LERVRQLAAQRHTTANQIALAWLLAHPFPVIPILGTTDPVHLTEALSAAAVELSPDDVQWLRG
jgi:aryl-alcohol dehydrogenase-like predicted oxidoreductase